MTVELDAIVERLAAGAAGGEGVEAYAELTTETSVSAYEGEVERLTSASSSGVGVRVVKDGRLGYAYTADLSDAGLRECLAEARANLEVSGEDPGNVLPEAAAYEALDGLFDTRQAEVDPERKVSLALDLEARTRAADPKVTQVESARYGDVVGEVAIASSLGVTGSFAVTHAWCVSIAMATEDGQSQVGYGVDAARALEDLDPGPVAREAADRAVRMLGAAQPPTRTVPVVFDRMVAPSLLGVLLAGLSAEEVQKRRSLFADRLGQQVGAAGLRLVDDGRLVDGPGAAPFDGEGVPTRRTVLIDDGVLQCFLHNTATAARDDGDASSTGNARRGSFKSPRGLGPQPVPGAGRARPGRPAGPGRRGPARPGRVRRPLRRQPDHRRLLGRGERPVVPRRPAGRAGQGGDRGRPAARHPQGHRRRRLRPPLHHRLDRRLQPPDRRDDRRRRLR